jgi:hypothetical protein
VNSQFSIYQVHSGGRRINITCTGEMVFPKDREIQVYIKLLAFTYSVFRQVARINLITFFFLGINRDTKFFQPTRDL